MKVGKVILGVVLGLLIAVAVFCLVVLVASSINKITFVEQIKEWFGIAKEVAEQTTETTALIRC